MHFHTHSLRLIRNSIPLSTAIIIASSFMLPRFNYCNSILLNLPDYHINRLQLAQNSDAFSNRFSCMNIKSIFKDQHWLPIKYRIIFKNLLHNAYISTNMVIWQKLYIFSSISISYYWNNIPFVIRSATVSSTFKSKLICSNRHTPICLNLYLTYNYYILLLYFYNFHDSFLFFITY